MHSLEWEAIDRIPGYMSRPECEWLAMTAASAGSWTELGAYCGRSMLCVGLHLPHRASLRVVDQQLGMISRAGQTLFTTCQELEQKRPDIELVLIRNDSVRAALLLPDSDVVFVDASHEFQSVLLDIDAWRPKCRLLCGHDYNESDWPDVVRAVNARISHPKLVAGSIWVDPSDGE